MELNYDGSIFWDDRTFGDDEDRFLWTGGTLDGKPVERTTWSHPYSFDSFVQWRHDDWESANGSVYSDRLYQWDWDKYNELCEKHFGNQGQMWDRRGNDKIEAFLRDYLDDQSLQLLVIMKCCNQSSGYPLWFFSYRTDGE